MAGLAAEMGIAPERLELRAAKLLRDGLTLEREAERHALENERLRSQLLFYATAPLGRAAAKGRGGARSKSAHSLTMPLPPV